MKYYLIDYENVNTAGLDGISDLTPDCRIVLFYTKNSSKIDLGIFNLLRNTEGELAVIEVHHGKQALDIQLASYVGFLIGTEPEDTEYYIVSKDKGYRNIQDFWSDRHIVLCTNLHEDSEIVDDPAESKPARSGAKRGRRSSSRSGAKAGKTEEKTEAEKTEKTPAQSERGESRGRGRKGIKTKAEQNSRHERAEKAAPAEAPAPEKETAAQQAQEPAPVKEAPVKEAPAEAKKAAEQKDAAQAEPAQPEEPKMNAFQEAAALAAAMAAEKRNKELEAEKAASAKAEAKEEAKAEAKAEVKADTAAQAPAEANTDADAEAADAKDAKGAKKESKPRKKSPAKAKAPKVSEIRNEVNTEIQKLLSKEGFSGDIINATASFVTKNIGKDGYKQLIYRGIIKEHGQKQGLAIYRLIKGLI